MAGAPTPLGEHPPRLLGEGGPVPCVSRGHACRVRRPPGRPPRPRLRRPGLQGPPQDGEEGQTLFGEPFAGGGGQLLSFLGDGKTEGDKGRASGCRSEGSLAGGAEAVPEGSGAFWRGPGPGDSVAAVLRRAT